MNLATNKNMFDACLLIVVISFAGLVPLLSIQPV